MIAAAARGAARAGIASAIAAGVLLAPSRLAVAVAVHPAPPESRRPAPDPLDLRREAILARLEDHLERRMASVPHLVHEALARAIVDEAEAARLDPLLVLAVIEVESGYDPSAASAAGARGLMQLQPATLRREVAGEGGGAADPQDPVANVRAGVRYLRRCLDSYPKLTLALMAYNTGPNRLHAFLLDGEVPAQVLAYPRRVLAEQHHLREVLGLGEVDGAGVVGVTAARD